MKAMSNSAPGETDCFASDQVFSRIGIHRWRKKQADHRVPRADPQGRHRTEIRPHECVSSVAPSHDPYNDGSLVENAHSLHEGVRMRYRNDEAIQAPIRTRFAAAASPRQRRSSHRRPG